MRSLIYRSRLFHSRVFASFSFVTLVALVAAAAGPALSQTQRVDVEAGVPAYLESIRRRLGASSRTISPRIRKCCRRRWWNC